MIPPTEGNDVSERRVLKAASSDRKGLADRVNPLRRFYVPPYHPDMEDGVNEAPPPDRAFDAAWEHIARASDARDLLLGCWNDLTKAGAFDCELVAESDTSGRLEITVVWPPDVAERAEASAARFADSIKAALDAAFAAVAGRPDYPDSPPVLPLCDSRAAFDAIRQGGVLRRLRPDQVEIVEAIEPFCVPDNDGLDGIRVAMAQLAAMTGPRDPASPRVALWACNIRAEYLTRNPDSWVNSALVEDGVVVDRLTIDRIECGGVTPGELRPKPNVGYLPTFNDEPFPADPGDSLIERANALIRIAETFATAMSKSQDLDEMRRRAGGSVGTRLQPSPPTQWAEVDLASVPDGVEIGEALARSDVGIGTLTDPGGAVSVLIAADGKVYARPLPPALPLAAELTTGIAAEKATLTAAASWGLPDFVFDPRVVDKGNASREIGDGTIIVDKRAIALQVKARESNSDTPERAVQWATKKVKEGAKQAAGTIRSLTSEPVELVDGRGRPSTVDGAALDWIRVVILEHPDNPVLTVEADGEEDVPTVPILRRDWDFLFDHLRSTSSVVDYLFRAAAEASHRVGQEPARYFEFAQEDEASARRDPGPWPVGLGQRPMSYPLLPTAPPDHADAQGHSMYRLVLEEIAVAALSGDEVERRRILALLDRYPVADRAELGRLLLDYLDDVSTAPDSSMWRFRRIILEEGGLHLAFGTCSTFSELHKEAFRRYATLRHHDLWADSRPDGPDEVLTIGVLLTPRYDNHRLWDTTLYGMQGDLGLLAEDIELMRRLWPNTPSK